jgi:hypothetical protein
MGPSYFQGLKWQDITREERAFCAELEFYIRKNPEKFIEILQQDANLPSELSGPWDTAYEACFYRDYSHRFQPSEKSNYHMKRTFDIALFSEAAIIIIEAKGAEIFTAKQSRDFENDISDIKRLLGDHIQVYLVALASQVYFDNYRKFGRGKALKPFDNRFLSWESIAGHYPDVPLLKRACQVYERRPVTEIRPESE